MKKRSDIIKQSLGILACSVISLAANAKGGIDTEYANVHVTGGASGGFYASNKEITPGNDQNRLSDFLFGLHAASKNELAEISAGIGILPSFSLLDHGVDETGSTAEIQYATLAAHPFANLTFEAGRISSNIGFENTPSFLNEHAMGSVQSTTQPGYFPGTRLSYGNDAITVYAERSDDAYEAPSGVSKSDSLAAGAMGTVAGVDYAVGYHTYRTLRSMFDLILTGNVAGMNMTFSVDYLKLTDKALATAGDTNHAESVALYASGPTFNKISIPVRVEAFNDHGNGLYEGAGQGFSLTVTPTWNMSENSYLRTDLSYLKSSNKILNGADNRFMFALQAGYRL